MTGSAQEIHLQKFDDELNRAYFPTRVVALLHPPHPTMTMPSEHRINDRPSYYTMTTPGPVPAVSPQGLAQAFSGSQSYFAAKPMTSPLSSPRLPTSAGQPYPPKLSPGVTRGATQDGRASSPSYFGLAVDPNGDPRDSCLVPRENWSSPSSSVKSFAAAIPKQLPLDANPEFEAFRRQIDANRARTTFSLSASHFGASASSPQTPLASNSPNLQWSGPSKWHTQGGDGPDVSFPQSSRLATAPFTLTDDSGDKRSKDPKTVQDSAQVSADLKRSSAVSMNRASLPPMDSRGFLLSTFRSPVASPNRVATSFNIFNAMGRQPPLPVTGNGADLGISSLRTKTGSTVPPQTSGNGGPSMITPAQLRDLLEEEGDQILLLDLRVSAQFAQSRVRGALNLCIPTTLLKRATFNLQKLQQTFQGDHNQEKFSRWRDARHLVVYDAASFDQRDASSAVHMIKKFTNEGYSGPASILRGGFNAFAAAYPSLVDRSSDGPSPGLSLGGGPAPSGPRANIPSVIGGVLLPNTDEIESPFFNNIRQNQDLVDGVGQMDVNVPSGLAPASLPRWLREAAETDDHGKRVSDKFLHIERTEQLRMREAYSVAKPTGAPEGSGTENTKVQLSGLEKGGKNRYKDILPFEHARVKLLGRPEGACDYVNASHLRAKRSYKRYIASQGPLPATFEDFWSVVWDNDVRVIVMLTAESEGGQLKCHPYWKGNDFGPMRLRVLSEKKGSLDVDKQRPSAFMDGSAGSAEAPSPDPSGADGLRRRANTTTKVESGMQTTNQFTFPPQAAPIIDTPYVIIRKFALSHTAHPFSPIREVTQLHYPSWPDFGAPAQPSHLLALVELANVMQRSAPPLGVPTALASAPSSRQNSDITPGSASSSSMKAGSNRGSAASLRREGSESLSPIWHDGPDSREHARPMLVHCSAGCGRTGAFCTVDSVIDMLKRQRQHVLAQSRNGTGCSAQSGAPNGDSSRRASIGGEAKPERLTVTQPRPPEQGSDIDTSWLDDDSLDLIAQTVEDFRGQRLSMVQSLRQFVLCYETVLEWLRKIQENDSGGTDANERGRRGSLAS
ncbi:hypothetical protein VTH06DRAFT_3948 [Thermothelomyces fergusii]